MSDLISRQDAIKAFYNPENGGTYSEFDDGSEWYMTSKQIYAVLESLPSAEPPYQYSEAYVKQLRGERDILEEMVKNMADRPTGWIPVSERLPENSGCVLISIAGDIEFGAYDRQNSDWAIWRDGYWDEGKRADAWMPLPEPYREDGEA